VDCIRISAKAAEKQSTRTVSRRWLLAEDGSWRGNGSWRRDSPGVCPGPHYCSIRAALSP